MEAEISMVGKNISEVSDIHPDSGYIFLHRVFSLVYTILGLLSIVSSVVLIITIVKFKRLRDDVTNRTFAHLNGFQALYYFISSIEWHFDVIIDIFHEDFRQISFVIYCTLNEIMLSLLLSLSLFFLLLVTDFYIKTYKKNTYSKFTRSTPFLIAIIYLTFICSMAVSTHFCVNSDIHYNAFHLVVACLLFLNVYLVVMNIIHAFKKRKLNANNGGFNLGLIVANITVLFLLPSFISLILSFFGVNIDATTNILLVLVDFSSPIFCLAYLYTHENNYHIFLKKIVTCQYNEYRNEDLEDHATVVYNNA